MRYSAGSTRYPVVNTCEKFNLNKQPPGWEDLPNMREARYYFNPCLYFGVIYLCGPTSSGNSHFEAFSLQPQEQFVQGFNISLPENQECCVYVADDLLVVHSISWIIKYQQGAQAVQLVERSRVQVTGVHKYQNTLPVIETDRKLFYISYNNSCIVLSMDNGQQVKTAS